MRVSTFLVLSIVACTLVQDVFSLECYVCTSCKDPFKAEGVTKAKCDGSCTKGKSSGGSTDTLVRGCLSSKMENGCQEESAGGVTAAVCYCDTDLCNTGASQYAASMGLAVIICALIVTIKNSIAY